MKKIFTLLMLPVIALVVILSERFYIAGAYFAAYTLVAAWLFSVTLWINQASLLLQKQRA